MFDIKIQILDLNSTSKSFKNPFGDDDFVYFISQNSVQHCYPTQPIELKD